MLFVDAATSCLQKPSANAKEIPLHLRGKASSLEDSTNRKPSRLDHFCDGNFPFKPYLWEEFSSAIPAFNNDQKGVDLSKHRRLWYYLGQPSTESKAQYTADPAKPVNDPASNFLQSVEPAKRPLIPQPQPGRRQSLPASYPGQYSASLNMPSPNAAMVSPRFTQTERLEQQKMDDYQRRMAILGSPAALGPPVQYHNSYSPASNHSTGSAYQNLPKNQNPELPNDPAAREAVLAKQRAILDRSQQRAMVLDQQDRPYLYKPKSSMPPPNIGIDTQSVERQREFQRRAYQQSLNSTQLSPHSPGMHSGFSKNGQITQWDQYAGGERGTGYGNSPVPPNTARYGQPAASPTEAAFPLLRRPHQQPISSSPIDPQQINYQLHNQPISSQEQSEHVNFFNTQRRLSQPTYPHPQFSPQPSTSSSPSPSHNFNMSSSGSIAPVDDEKNNNPPKRSNMSALRNVGQHTANFIDPNLMQLTPNHQTTPAPPLLPAATAANTDKNTNNTNKVQQASRSMPPPPLPTLAYHPTVTPSATAADHQARFAAYDRQYRAYQTAEAAEFDKKAAIFDSNLAAMIAEVEAKEEQQRVVAQKKTPASLINDKTVPPSIANLRYLADTHRYQPNVYTGPYPYGRTPSGVKITTASDREGTSTYGNGLLSKVVEVDEDEDANTSQLDDDDGDDDDDGEEWVTVKKADGKEAKEKTELDAEYVHVEIGDKEKQEKNEKKKAITFATVAAGPGPGPGPAAGRRRGPIGSAYVRGGGGGRARHALGTAGMGDLAKSFYESRSVEEQREIDKEARAMGWYVGAEVDE